jgi:hypothetical protein
MNRTSVLKSSSSYSQFEPAFKLWCFSIVSRPEVFFHWFQCLKKPKDVFYSFYKVVKKIWKSKVDLCVHSEYIQVFAKKRLRIPRALLNGEDEHILSVAEENSETFFRRRIQLYAQPTPILSNLVFPILIDRLQLLRIICGHFLSLDNFSFSFLQLLLAAVRKLGIWSLYEELVSDEVFQKMSSAPQKTLRCDQCDFLLNSPPGSEDWPEYFRNHLYGHALELVKAAAKIPGLDKLCSAPNIMLQLHTGKQFICHALPRMTDPTFVVPREVRDILDRFVMGIPSVTNLTFVPPERPPENLKIALQDKEYQGTPFDYGIEERTDQEKISSPCLVYSRSPLCIYPVGHYGGMFTVALTQRERCWQYSWIIHNLATAEYFVGTKYTPMAKALWCMLLYGDLHLFTRVIQNWALPKGDRQTLRPDTVPKRCLVRDNWKHLANLGNAIARADEGNLGDIMFWVIVGNFVKPWDKIYHFKQELTETDLMALVVHRDYEKLHQLTDAPTSTPVKRGAKEIFRTRKAPNGVVCEPLYGNNGYRLPHERRDSHSLGLLFTCLVTAEGCLRGGDVFKVRKQPIFEVTKTLKFEDCFVHFANRTRSDLVCLSDLTVVAPSPLQQPLPPFVPLPLFQTCSCRNSMPLLDYDDDQEDIMARRAAEREKNKNAKRHADLELNDIARRMLSTSEAGDSFASVTRNHPPSYATADGPPIGEVYLLGPGSPSSPY